MSRAESMRHISRALIGTCGSLLWDHGASIRSCPTRKCSCSRTTRMYWHYLPAILFRRSRHIRSARCSGSTGSRQCQKNAPPGGGGGGRCWACMRPRWSEDPMEASKLSSGRRWNRRNSLWWRIENEQNREQNKVSWRFAMSRKACVVGSGPNGLAAAIVLAQAGLQVDVFEAEPTAGGAARTMELTLPGFLHDFGSAVHPMAAGSPFFSSLSLEDHGLEWIHSPAPLAHPLDDGTAVVLERDLGDAKTSLGADGNAWGKLMQPFVEAWSEFAPDVLRPVCSIPKHPWLMARFGTNALRSARTIVRRFQSERTRALFAGLAAHSFLSLDEPLSGAFGMLMAVPAHV